MREEVKRKKKTRIGELHEKIKIRRKIKEKNI